MTQAGHRLGSAHSQLSSTITIIRGGHVLLLSLVAESHGLLTMQRMTIRHLMLLVLYVAVILTLITPAIRTPWPQNATILFFTVLMAPAAMSLFTVLILRPGPHRDWVAMFFLLMTYAALGLMYTIGILSGIAIPDTIAGTWKEPINWGINWYGGIAYWLGMIFVARHFLIPRQCPHCRRNTLLQSFPGNDTQRHGQQQEDERLAQARRPSVLFFPVRSL